MSIFIIFILLLFGNWLLSDALVFVPVSILGEISSFSRISIAIAGLLFLSWCLGDE